jgi:hypothetical protein
MLNDQQKRHFPGDFGMNEIWLPVTGYEGLYEVSSFGRVRSLNRIHKSRNQWGEITRSWPAKLLRLNRQIKTGYYHVQLCSAGKIKAHLVHRLVCEAFNGPSPQGLECAHLDGTRTNNSAENLKWLTSKENQSHRVIHGTANIGDNAHQAILCEAEIPRIRERRKQGETYRNIAEDYGVHLSTIHYACNGKNWSCVA